MTDTTQHDEEITQLKAQAEEIAKAGLPGWGNTMLNAADSIARLREQLEVERMRLAACGVVAMANTPESAAKNRQMKDEYRSGSLDDVIHIVDSEMALRKQVVAQQARIVRLKEIIHFANHYQNIEHCTVCNATPDDLSALKAHDDALWGKALTRGIKWQATRGHTLDADDYENELRSLKR